ncbi:hypothetical protein D3C71_1795950 [compost metagenome]
MQVGVGALFEFRPRDDRDRCRRFLDLLLVACSRHHHGVEGLDLLGGSHAGEASGHDRRSERGERGTGQKHYRVR